MIIYETGEWACKLAIILDGSVVPRTLRVCVPAGLLAAVMDFIFANLKDMPNDLYDSHRTDQFLGTFTSVLGFLIVFRTRIAYSRFWEAASFLQTIRGGWFNVVSACFAFCSADETKLQDVFRFQHTLVRLVSLLYASALHEVAVMKDNSFEVLDFDGFDSEQFDYMQENSKKTEILIQWIQRLIMDGLRRGTLDVPPPILSRVFQELANGVLDLANAKRICRYPFPFPYAQIQALLLLFHWGISVWIAGTTMANPARAFIFAFVSTFCLWSMHYTSLEIEQPYGDDSNDLPLNTMQTSLNDSLVNLLNPLSQKVAKVHVYDTAEIQCKLWKTHRNPNARMKEMQLSKVKSVAKMGPRAYQTASFSKVEDLLTQHHSESKSNLDAGRFTDPQTPEEPEDLLIYDHLRSQTSSKRKNSEGDELRGREELLTDKLTPSPTGRLSHGGDQRHNPTAPVVIRTLSLRSAESAAVRTLSIKSPDRISRSSSPCSSPRTLAKSIRFQPEETNHTSNRDPDASEVESI